MIIARDLFTRNLDCADLAGQSWFATRMRQAVQGGTGPTEAMLPTPRATIQAADRPRLLSFSCADHSFADEGSAGQ